MSVILEFLANQLERGLGVSSIGTYRSALSNYLPPIDGVQIGDHKLMTKFMKGIRNLKPSSPRYAQVWDTDVVVTFLKRFDQSTLKNLTLKLTMVLALVTGQRAQTLSKLKLSEMERNGDTVRFRIGEHLKTKLPGTAVIEFSKFTPDSAVCPVHLMDMYIALTKDLRSDDFLLISFVKPYKAVHVDSIRRWIIQTMTMAGVDTSVYKPHTTRSASTSKAAQQQVPIDVILKAGMWSNESTFAKFYKKPIVTTEVSTFQNAVLNVKGAPNQ